MSLSQKEKDFAHAMALKLRLNREARAKREEEQRLREEYGDFRYDKEQEPGPLYHRDRGDGSEPVVSNYPLNCWDELMDIEHLYVFHPEHGYWQHIEQEG